MNLVSFRWVARGAGVLCASAALIFGLAGASAAAPAVVPSNTTPSVTPLQMPDDEDIGRCRDNKARFNNDADL